MRRDDIQPDATPLPDGYRLEQDTTDSIDTVRVLAADDSVVATGHVVVTDHTAIYDRVVTQEEHRRRSEEHTSELQSLMRTSYAVFCLKKKTRKKNPPTHAQPYQERKKPQ